VRYRYGQRAPDGAMFGRDFIECDSPNCLTVAELKCAENGWIEGWTFVKEEDFCPKHTPMRLQRLIVAKKEAVNEPRHMNAMFFGHEDAEVPLCGADPKGALLVENPEDVTCLACVKQHASSLRRKS